MCSGEWKFDIYGWYWGGTFYTIWEGQGGFEKVAKPKDIKKTTTFFVRNVVARKKGMEGFVLCLKVNTQFCLQNSDSFLCQNNALHKMCLEPLLGMRKVLIAYDLEPRLNQ